MTDGNKSVAEAVDLSWWCVKGELRIHDDTYTARRDKSSYALESASGVLARAERPRKWFRDLVIEHSGQRYTLPNGNGRHQRIMADIVLTDSLRTSPINWDGGYTLQAMNERRKSYIHALQQADVIITVHYWNS